MKKQLTILLVSFSFLFPLFAHAYAGQYPWDPLYVEEIETPSERFEKNMEYIDNRFDDMFTIDTSQQNKNNSTINRLKSWYGLTNFYSCYNDCGYSDLSNPSTMNLCLIVTEKCLERKQISEEKKVSQTCSPGYTFYNNKCENYDKVCKDNYGNNSHYNGTFNDKGQFICDCLSGYRWEGDVCVQKLACPDVKKPININGQCVDSQAACALVYGQNSERGFGPDVKCLNYEGYDIQGSLECCKCKTGYKWDDNQTNCVDSSVISNSISVQKLDTIVAEEKSLVAKIDNTLSNRLQGNILLQVEQNGEGWYVYPDDKKKYYLGRPADAFGIMRNLGLGIKHGELLSYLNFKFPSRLSGKILLDVEQNGEAYYVNPNDLKGYFLNRPADAFKIMRELGLGITNTDIRKIDVGEVE